MESMKLPRVTAYPKVKKILLSKLKHHQQSAVQEIDTKDLINFIVVILLLLQELSINTQFPYKQLILNLHLYRIILSVYRIRKYFIS